MEIIPEPTIHATLYYLRLGFPSYLFKFSS